MTKNILGPLGRRIKRLVRDSDVKRSHGIALMDTLEARRLMTTVTFANATYTVDENGEDIVVEVLRSNLSVNGGITASFAASCAFAGAGNFPASSNDYSLTGDTDGTHVTFGPNDGSACVTIHAVNDSSLEGQEILKFTAHGNEGATATCSIGINDDDFPYLSLTRQADVTEGNTAIHTVIHRAATGSGHDASTITVTFVATPDGSSAADLGYDWTTFSGSGVTNLGNGTYTFTMDGSTPDKTLNVDTVNDGDYESVGTLSMECSGNVDTRLGIGYKPDLGDVDDAQHMIEAITRQHPDVNDALWTAQMQWYANGLPDYMQLTAFNGEANVALIPTVSLRTDGPYSSYNATGITFDDVSIVPTNADGSWANYQANVSASGNFAVLITSMTGVPTTLVVNVTAPVLTTPSAIAATGGDIYYVGRLTHGGSGQAGDVVSLSLTGTGVGSKISLGSSTATTDSSGYWHVPIFGIEETDDSDPTFQIRADFAWINSEGDLTVQAPYLDSIDFYNYHGETASQVFYGQFKSADGSFVYDLDYSLNVTQNQGIILDNYTINGTGPDCYITGADTDNLVTGTLVCSIGWSAGTGSGTVYVYIVDE